MKKFDFMKNIKVSVIAIGVITAIVISLTAVVLEACLVLKGSVSYSTTVYLSSLIIAISLFAANGVLKLLKIKIDLKHILMICVAYFICIIAVNMLIFNDGFNNTIYNIVGVGGGFAASLLHIRQSGRGISHSKKLRFR